MKNIEQMLVGNLKMSEFLVLLKCDPDTITYIKNIVPRQAVENTEHPFWKCVSFSSLKRFNFDYLAFLNWICRFDGTIADNLNVFVLIRNAYCFYHPELMCTNQYIDAYSLYLDGMKDCFDGPEVRHIVEEIIQTALLKATKRDQSKFIRESIRKFFHVCTNKHPKWIQGPEWPMGSFSPMMYVSQERVGETIQYTFADYDTQEQRIIVQRY